MLTPSGQNKLSQIAASKAGARLWRMAVGFGWIAGGKGTLKATKPTTVTMQPGDVLLRQARPFRAGVEGMSDNAGLVPVKITQDMVGQTVAVSLWVEDKQGSGRPTPEQKAWIAMVRGFGGRAGIARNEDDVVAIARGEIRD